MNRQVPDPHEGDDYYTDELLELLWRKGPAEQPVELAGWAPAPAPPGAACELERVFAEEDDMAAWLCQIVEGPGAATAGSSHAAGNNVGAPRQEVRDAEAATAGSSSASPETAAAEEAPLRQEDAGETASKRKVAVCSHCSADAESDSTGKKKDTCGSAAPKRPRSAQMHNLTERKRRDKINEKMKTLQGLVPSCNKVFPPIFGYSADFAREKSMESDKASMLDDTIGYLKSLQLQVQIMSMGYGMRPVMYPGIQPCVQPAIGVGMGAGVLHMGVAMGPRMPAGAEARAGVGVRPPVFPFSAVFPYPHPPVMASFSPPNAAAESIQMRYPPSNLQASASANVTMHSANMFQVPCGGEACYSVRPSRLKESPQIVARDKGRTRTQAKK